MGRFKTPMQGMAASRTEKYLRSEAVVSRAIAGETLIVPIRGRVGDLASIYSLNDTASTIWEALETPATLLELAQRVAEEYHVSVAKAEEDITALVDEMCYAGLVTIEHAASDALNEK